MKNIYWVVGLLITNTNLNIDAQYVMRKNLRQWVLELDLFFGQCINKKC